MHEVDDNDFITLINDIGDEIDCLLLDVIEYGDLDYLVLLELSPEHDLEDQDVFYMAVYMTEDGEAYIPIESEEVYAAVDAIFQQRVQKWQQEDCISFDQIPPAGE